jgi:hypothetical protein
MARKLAKTPCEKKIPQCDCTLEACDHWCCAFKRELHRKRVLKKMAKERGALVPRTPEYKALSRQMERFGKTPSDDDELSPADLAHVFDEANQSAVVVMGNSMREARLSQEREHNLNRLLKSVPRLTTASDLGLVMEFLYRIQCDASSMDMALALKAAVAQCGVQRFATILRAAPVSKDGWEQACVHVLASINKHFMQSSKESLMKEMKQIAGEDPTLYADRVLAKLDVYVYFAGLTRKAIDDQETARAWVAGLDSTTRMTVSVALDAKVTYSIQDALSVARIAYTASSTNATDSALHMLDSSSFVPQAPVYDAGFLQQMIETAVSQSAASFDARLASMVPQVAQDSFDARIASMVPQVAQGSINNRVVSMAPLGTPTKFPCRHPDCHSAMHRFEDCPNRQQCIHCRKPGHHSAGCYTKFPALSHFTKPTREPYRGAQGRDRSPPDVRDRGRNRSRDRDRDRDRSRRPRSPPRATTSPSGKRLNGRGRE